MKLFGWTIAIVSAVIFVLSFWAETRLAPIFGAGLLLASIAYATWMTNSSGRNLLKAERATRRQRAERAREPR
ncbi:MAG: hypothetical protein SXU28_03735 [Pseudomonadota bacterium]|nr:hypothetical protein [Pseudomonadota bacterium]